MQKFACRSMQTKSKLDLCDFYFCAEQNFTSLVTSLFENPPRSVCEKSAEHFRILHAITNSTCCFQQTADYYVVAILKIMVNEKNKKIRDIIQREISQQDNNL